MLNKIIHFSVENKLLIGLFTIGLVLWGSYSLTNLPIDAVPDITNNQVQVITSSPSLAAEEVERLITFPIETTMATIPKIDEIRSFSRFGLSVVTIVFQEQVDVYWARQQVSERLPEAEAQIPKGAGMPGMAPVTTGLGEIYQYVISAKPGYEHRYDARELRTIQDWIVRRQLLGTPGVADVSSFGGYLKQYEIAVNPDQLKSRDVSLEDIFLAVQSNNENTGGAYIEKNKQAFFIRSEGLVGGIEDIENIAVRRNPNGIPILIKDVAKVQIGHAVRYGASTRNGEGEVVSAIVMMLKGENSAAVIENVKNKIDQIRKTLPEGIQIEPFLDRTKLVNHAIGTVTRNLTEGALIVIFVLLLLMGNVRAGLIVASVIPLSLLFAFGLMNFFGVSGNLMSLGAIDFGLIVDGAVIIVEATLYHLSLLNVGRRLTQQEMDLEVYQAASKIRSSAAFGEIIILIVYLPILALVGTEGKMFRPMAQTVSFAILGAFILSLTYIPMMSALFLSKENENKKNISDGIIAFFQRTYNPVIQWAMHKRMVVLGLAVALFALSIWVFSTLGGEFIPTLEEGDFAVETRVMTGSSLKNTIRATSEAEKIILDQFPEVQQIVSKIGSGEIPTDPMPIEGADLMIILDEKENWVSAHSREELANKMSKALEVIPGVTFGFQQPIQMRFNELMTGVRQDVAIKIYGDDLNELSMYASQVVNMVSNVNGAVDLYREEVTGVPQIVINFKRHQLSKYGLSVGQVNEAIQTAFAGASAGLVYEGEKRFDLVVRLNERYRHDLKEVQNLYISRDDGHQIPLYQVAEVTIKDGPYQIQRDDTRRRIIVAFNVRNRDVESVVKEIQNKIEASVQFAPGYTVTYGGQFENLVEARERLSVAVPIALLLIFILLYFMFKSINQSILIFTAIPLSAIGGVFALYLRGMPFSISAGVGFIALFGVAVLNGIVLIAEFNHLKKEGVVDIFKRIYQGTRTRLRPVIMTASVASFGFLPMALSKSGGAEVQKPLATVVIGGLISATLLTLVVLPILYYYFERGIRIKRLTLILVFIVGAFFVQLPKAAAQGTPTSLRSLDEAIQVAIENNPNLLAADLRTQQQQVIKISSWDLQKTDLRLEYGQTNSVYDNDSRVSISQRFAFPTVYASQNGLAKSRIEAGKRAAMAKQNELVSNVKSIWYSLWTSYAKQELLSRRDSIFERFALAAELRYKTGESTLLEKITAETEVAEIHIAQQQNKADVELFKTQLTTLLNVQSTIDIRFGPISIKNESDLNRVADISNNPVLAWFQHQTVVAESQKAVEKSKLLPDITLGYFNQSFNGPGQNLNGDPVTFNSGNRFAGIQLGLAIPVFSSKSQTAAIKVAELKKQESIMMFQATSNEITGRMKSLMLQYQNHQSSLEYYRSNALPKSELILKQAQKGYGNGELSYVEYIWGLNKSLEIQFNYLELVNALNQTIIQIEFISGIQ